MTIPLLWRYLSVQYLKILILSTVTFIALLLTTRFDEIAHFACLGGSWWQVLGFTVLLLPYLLPIALPLSGLLAAFLTFRHLSRTHELTALRACGLSFMAILAPLLTTATLLAILNFYLVSELAPAAHLANRLQGQELRSVNPMLLLSNRRLLQLQGIYSEALGSINHGKWAHDVIMAMPGSREGPLRLVVAKELRVTDNSLIGEKITLLGAEPAPKGGFDQILLENIGYAETPLDDFAPILRQRVWSLHPDHLKLSLLLAAIAEEREEAAIMPTQIGLHRLHAAYTEIFRRISLTLALCSLTLLGAACGIQLGRERRKFPLAILALLTLLYLVAYFLAKGLEDQWLIASLLLLMPHILIATTAIWLLSRHNRGVE